MRTACILLTVAEATLVRGPSMPGAALAPSLLADGQTYALPTQVLEDPAHAAWHGLLSALPRQDVAPENWPVPALPGG